MAAQVNPFIKEKLPPKLKKQEFSLVLPINELFKFLSKPNLNLAGGGGNDDEDTDEAEYFSGSEGSDISADPDYISLQGLDEGEGVGYGEGESEEEEEEDEDDSKEGLVLKFLKAAFMPIVSFILFLDIFANINTENINVNTNNQPLFVKMLTAFNFFKIKNSESSAKQQITIPGFNVQIPLDIFKSTVSDLIKQTHDATTTVNITPSFTPADISKTLVEAKFISIGIDTTTNNDAADIKQLLNDVLRLELKDENSNYKSLPLLPSSSVVARKSSSVTSLMLGLLIYTNPDGSVNSNTLLFSKQGLSVIQPPTSNGLEYTLMDFAKLQFPKDIQVSVLLTSLSRAPVLAVENKSDIINMQSLQTFIRNGLRNISFNAITQKNITNAFQSVINTLNPFKTSLQLEAEPARFISLPSSKSQPQGKIGLPAAYQRHSMYLPPPNNPFLTKPPPLLKVPKKLGKFIPCSSSRVAKGGNSSKTRNKKTTKKKTKKPKTTRKKKTKKLQTRKQKVIRKQK